LVTSEVCVVKRLTADVSRARNRQRFPCLGWGAWGGWFLANEIGQRVGSAGDWGCARGSRRWLGGNSPFAPGINVLDNRGRLFARLKTCPVLRIVRIAERRLIRVEGTRRTLIRGGCRPYGCIRIDRTNGIERRYCLRIRIDSPLDLRRKVLRRLPNLSGDGGLSRLKELADSGSCLDGISSLGCPTDNEMPGKIGRNVDSLHEPTENRDSFRCARYRTKRVEGIESHIEPAKKCGPLHFAHVHQFRIATNRVLPDSGVATFCESTIDLCRIKRRPHLLNGHTDRSGC
jgi:hypothetical protein